jgi:hypothetical protein
MQQADRTAFSELRAIEIIANGEPGASFTDFGETMPMAGRAADRREPLGALDQQAAPFALSIPGINKFDLLKDKIGLTNGA